MPRRVTLRADGCWLEALCAVPASPPRKEVYDSGANLWRTLQSSPERGEAEGQGSQVFGAKH